MGPSHKLYLWVATCSYQECRSILSPEFGSASPPGKQFTFSLKGREEQEKIVGVFLFYETPSACFFPSQNWLAPTLSKNRLAAVMSMRDVAFAFYKVSERPDRGDMYQHECLWQ